MKGLRSYSGMSTKVRAMRRNLLSKDDFINISYFTTIAELVTFLKNNKAYHQILERIDLTSVSRESLEKLLVYSPCIELNKLYKFADFSQRKFIDSFFIYYHIRFLKIIIRKLYNKTDIPNEYIDMSSIFLKHSLIDFKKVSDSLSINDLIINLKETIFYDPLDKMITLSNPKLIDYEMCLDLFYYKNLWKVINSLKSKKDQEVMANTYGKIIDMLNIMWVYRLKKYYNIPKSHIYSFLIPINYKLSNQQLTKLVDSENIEAFSYELATSYYGKYFTMETMTPFEIMYNNLMNQMHIKDLKDNAYSIAVINTFFYLKVEEIRRIITVAECIRYRYTPEKILSTLQLIGGLK